MTETPEELATRALAIIDSAVLPRASAIVLDTAMGPESIAARSAASADDPRLEEIVPSLAAALRVSRGRYSRESHMQQRLDEMAARLAQLEGGAAKPAYQRQRARAVRA